MTEDGYALVNSNDTLFFATLSKNGEVISNHIQAENVEKRTKETISQLDQIDKAKVLSRICKNEKQMSATTRSLSAREESSFGLFNDASFPRNGNQRALVILVEFSDIKFRNDYNPTDYFYRLLNEKDFSDYHATGSARDYFLENSNGVFCPEFDVYGPVSLSKPSVYYGANDINGSDMRPAQMIIDACRMLDGEIDFTAYDRDNDGNIDNVFVFYAGRGEASGGLSTTIWPHSGNVNYNQTAPITLDGKILGRYACTNEWDGEKPDGIGTFIHEFSHVLGLPDLYATSYTGAFTPGSWSVMDHGSYNNDSRTPPLYSSFERYSLGWIQPPYVCGTQTVSLDYLGANDALIIPTSDNNEKFFIENRQQIKWDMYIPGHGMLVWHVIYDKDIWMRNIVNNSPELQYVNIVEADNIEDNDTRRGDSFPGTAQVTSLSPTSHKQMKCLHGKTKDFIFENIDEHDGIVNFNCIFQPDEIAVPENISAKYINATSFVLYWEQATDIDNYYISISQIVNESDNGTIMLGDEFQMIEAGKTDNKTIAGLSPESIYSVRMYASSDGYLSRASKPIIVKTPDCSTMLYKPTAYPPDNIKTSSAIAKWDATDLASDCLLSLFEIVDNGPNTAYNGFDNGVKLENGWTTSALMTGNSSVNSGKLPPSLLFMQNGGYIDSPMLSEIKSVKLWYKATINNLLAEPLSIILYGNDGSEWLKLSSITVSSYGEPNEVTFDSIIDNIKQIRIRIESAPNIKCYIDDITVSYGSNISEQLLPDYPRLVRNSGWFTIDGLSPSKTYSYELRATDGITFSEPSNKIIFQTPAYDSSQSSIAINETEDIRIQKSSGGINIFTGSKTAQIELTNINGVIIYNRAANADQDIYIPIPQPGFYILRIGRSTHKIIF